MGRAKEIVLKSIDKKTADAFVKTHHYSGKICNNSGLHLGAFLDNVLHGVMQFRPPMDKGKVLPLVHNYENRPVLWNEMLELNRMAFDDFLPKNSESRCIAVAVKLLKKYAPHVKWILSFSDAAQCGDGAIYRASGFILTKITPNKSIIEMPDGERIAQITITANGFDRGGQCERIIKKYGIELRGGASLKPFFEAGAKYIEGYQLRYVYLIDKTLKLNCPNIPFAKIQEIGAGMYKGIKIVE